MATNSTALGGLQAMFGRINTSQVAAPVLILMILAMMVLPLPAFVLDVFFTFNIAISVLVKLPAIESNASKGYTLKEVNAFLTEKNYFFLKFAMASALFNVAVYAAGVWLPTFLQRCYQLDTAASGKLLGIAMLTVAPVGAVAGGYIGDRFSINRVKAIVSTIFMVMICFTLLLFSPTGYFQYIPLFLPLLLMLLFLP